MRPELEALRKTAAAIVGAKRKGDVQEVKQLETDGLLHVLKIKDANKRLCARVEAAKEQTVNSKLSLETADSTLQNLLYEKNYYIKEIHTCRNFVSKHKDEEVLLMPEDQFRQSLGESKEEQEWRAQADSSTHECMKARLVHENTLRKSLMKRLEDLKQEKQTLHDAVSVQQKALKELKIRLEKVQDSAKPVQTVLGATLPLKNSVSKTAEMLPTPLYIAYSQVVAAGEALQLGCSASIAGSPDEAESFARSLAQEPTSPDKGHPNNHPAQPAQDDLHKAHPLTVELHVHKDPTFNSSTLKAPTILITVVLQYLPGLRVVTAHAKDPADNAVLKSLFPADDGSGIPSEALAQLQGGHFRFSATHVARPYRWCQHLAGLDFVPTVPQLAVQLQPGEQLDSVLAGLEGYRKQQRVGAIVARLRQAKLSEHTLNQHLTQSWVLHNYLPADMSMYQGPPTSVILLWELEAASGPSTVQHTPSLKRVRLQPPPSPVSAGQQTSGKAGAGAAGQDGEVLDDGELPAEDHQQQPVAGRGPAAAAASEPGSPSMDPGEVSEGGSAMWGGARSQGPDEEEEEEEGALPDQPANDKSTADQLRSGGSVGDEGAGVRRRDDKRSWQASEALKRLFQEQEEAAESQHSQRRQLAHRRFRLVARSLKLELEAAVFVFGEYPWRAPVVQVRAVRQLTPAAGEKLREAMAKGFRHLPHALSEAAGPSLGASAINHLTWIEHQVNVAALALVPKTQLNNTMFYQLTHLRMALDSVTRAYEAAAASQGPLGAPSKAGGHRVEDVAVLHLRQQLVGRERNPPPVEKTATGNKS